MDTKGVSIVVSVTSNTVISPPAASGTALAEIFSPLPAKVAVVGVAPPANGQAEARFLAAIPNQVTRQHQRTVVTEVNDNGLTTVDSQGRTINATGVTGINPGDSLVVLVRPDRGGGNARGNARFLARSSDVDQRLIDFGAGITDPFEATRFERLKTDRFDATEDRLQQTLDRTTGNDRSTVGQALDQARHDRASLQGQVARAGGWNEPLKVVSQGGGEAPTAKGRPARRKG